MLSAKGAEFGRAASLMHAEFFISLSDLRFVSIRCPHCGTRITLDMAQDDFSVGGRYIFGPESCAGCRKPFDSTVAQNINALHAVYKGLPQAVAECITFSSPKTEDGLQQAEAVRSFHGKHQ